MADEEGSGLEVLVAPNVLEYPYTRTVGPIIGQFMTGLRDGRIVGIRAADGRVLVPPTEYDPATGEDLDEIVAVGQAGTVTTWAWVGQPRPKHPLDRPFAWALIRLDGADTAMLHVVDAGDESRMRTGMRVVARWRDERVGEIRDIACFVPEEDGAERPAPTGSAGAEPVEPVLSVRTPIELHYRYTPGRASSRFLRHVAEGRMVGQRCPQCGKVYVPPRGACASCGCPTDEEVDVSDKGTVTTFCVVNVPFYGQKIEIPYVSATILLDGADIGLMHLVQECEASDVHMGMRVEAVWAPPAELRPSLESIRYFRPTGEPDAPFDTYRDYV